MDAGSILFYENLLVDSSHNIRQKVPERFCAVASTSLSYNWSCHHCLESGRVVADNPSAKRAVSPMSPDLQTIDISLASDNGLNLVRELSGSTGILPILVLSLHDEVIWTKRAIRARARGYLMKSDAGDNVALALRNIQSGRIHASTKILAWHPDLMLVRPAAASANYNKKEQILSNF